MSGGPLRILPVLFAVALPTLAADVPLVRDGKPVAALVVPAKPTPTLQTAAAEITTYVSKITGASIPLGPQPGLTSRVVLSVDRAALGREDAFRIVTEPGRVRLIGGGEMGVLYAAYAFLEDLGVRWLIPGEDGEVVPRRRTLSYPQTDRTSAPAFGCRFFYVRSEDASLWAVRNRVNGLFQQDFALAHGNGYYLPPMVRSIHSFAHILPPSKYYEAHPEYYALLRGVRVASSIRRNQVCTCHPEVVGLLSKAIRGYFHQTPTARCFSIAPNDGYGWCQCRRCRTAQEQLCRGKTWFHRPSEPVVSDRLCLFANQVASRAVHDMPDKDLYMFAYVSYAEPPETVRPDPHVTHVVCHYVPACYAHPINTPGCPDNEIYKRILEGWSRISPQMMVYAYTDKSQWLGLPRPVVRPMAADVRFCHSLGVRKYIAQSSASNWPQMASLYYVTAKLLWQPDRDVEELIREWNEGMYHAAAKEMMAWYDAVEAVVAQSGGHYRGDPYLQAPCVYRPGCFADAMSHLDRALALADSERVRERVERVKAQFEYGAAGVDVICLNARWEDSGDLAALKQAQATAARLLASRRGWGGISIRRFKEYLEGVRSVQTDGVRWEGWGEPEEKGGRQCRNSDESGPGDAAQGWAAFHVIISDPERGYRVTMEVWGKSQFSRLLICSKGKGKGTASGGVWQALAQEGQVSGKPEWCTITFTVPPEMLDKQTRKQRFGFGGGDSQVWVSDIRFE